MQKEHWSNPKAGQKHNVGCICACVLHAVMHPLMSLQVSDTSMTRLFKVLQQCCYISAMPTDCVKQLFSTRGVRALWWASANVQVGLILEGIVHPKMKLLSSFTHPHIVPNLYKLTCVKHNRIWRTKLKNQTVVDPHWLPWVNNTTGTIICLITSTLQNIFFCVQHEKKTLTSVWNNMRVSKLWRNFHFGVNYPFKINHVCFKKTHTETFWVKMVENHWLQY